MNVYDFLTLATSLNGVVVRVFDCTSEDIVYDSGKGCDDVLYDLDEADLDGCEVDSYDLYIDFYGNLTLELNVSTDEEKGTEQ